MMFFSIRRWLVLALAVSTVVVLSFNSPGASHADTPTAAATPPVLGVNDPQNPFHLTADQQKKAIALKLTFQQEASAIMQSTSIPGNQKQAKIEALQLASTAELKAMLTPSQLASVNNITGKQQEAVLLEKKGEAILSQLTHTFTPAQSAKLQQIRSDAQTQAAAIQNSAASNQVKNNEITALRTQFQSQTAAVLNLPNQQAMIKEIKQIQGQVTAISRQLQQPPH